MFEDHVQHLCVDNIRDAGVGQELIPGQEHGQPSELHSDGGGQPGLALTPLAGQEAAVPAHRDSQVRIMDAEHALVAGHLKHEPSLPVGCEGDDASQAFEALHQVVQPLEVRQADGHVKPRHAGLSVFVPHTSWQHLCVKCS